MGSGEWGKRRQAEKEFPSPCILVSLSLLPPLPTPHSLLPTPNSPFCFRRGAGSPDIAAAHGARNASRIIARII